MAHLSDERQALVLVQQLQSRSRRLVHTLNRGVTSAKRRPGPRTPGSRSQHTRSRTTLCPGRGRESVAEGESGERGRGPALSLALSDRLAPGAHVEEADTQAGEGHTPGIRSESGNCLPVPALVELFLAPLSLFLLLGPRKLLELCRERASFDI